MADSTHELILEFSLATDPERDASALRVARILPGFDAQTLNSGREWVRCGLRLPARPMPLGTVLREAEANTRKVPSRLPVTETDLLSALQKRQEKSKSVSQDQDGGME